MNSYLTYQKEDLRRALCISLNEDILQEKDEYVRLINLILMDKPSNVAAVYFYVEMKCMYPNFTCVCLSSNEYSYRRYKYTHKVLKNMARDDMETVFNILNGSMKFSMEWLSRISQRTAELKCSYVTAYLSIYDVKTGKLKVLQPNEEHKGIKQIPKKDADRDAKAVTFTVNEWSKMLEGRMKDVDWSRTTESTKRQVLLALKELENIVKVLKRRIK